MAISCPCCGAGYDVTLFQFGHPVRCDCGAVLEYPGNGLRSGHTLREPLEPREDAPMAEVPLGRITHYFDRIRVAAVEITQDTLAVGDTIHVTGRSTDCLQQIDSMQIDGHTVQEATAGQVVGVRVLHPVEEHDLVHKVIR